jgi:hypothetical protein
VRHVSSFGFFPCIIEKWLLYYSLARSSTPCFSYVCQQHQV